MEQTITKKHKGPSLGWLTVVFTLLFNTGLAFVISLTGKGAYFPGPWESADTIVNYFQHHQRDVLLCAFFQFGAAIPLGIFTATVVSRIQFLGSTAAGNHIALFGGFLTAFNLAFSSMMMWVMAYPEMASEARIIRCLYYIVFISGGVGYSVPLGLLIAGIAVQSWFMRILPRWLAGAGIVLAVVGEVSGLYMLFPALLFAIPLTRFPGFAWLILVGFKLPKTKSE